MSRSAGKATLAGITALALAMSAVGPCVCFLDGAACHREAREAEAHACCEKPAGVQAVADECCDGVPEVLLASTDVPEVGAPSVQTGHAAPVRPTLTLAVAGMQAPPPHPPDRTTVLLI